MSGSKICPSGCSCRKHSRQPRRPRDEELILQREISKAHYEANREAILERQRTRRADPVAGDELRQREQWRRDTVPDEERERRAQLYRERYQSNPRPSQDNTRAHLKYRYGITLEGRQQMLESQDGCCYLCGGEFDFDQSRRIHVDHDHDCCSGGRSCGGCIRGLSCEHCNRGIGMFGNDPERMRRAADALEAANARVRNRPVPV